MTAQRCPKCGDPGFVWSIDESVTRLTQWRCAVCGYFALENEALEGPCDACSGSTSIVLFDEISAFRYCLQCRRRADASPPPDSPESEMLPESSRLAHANVTFNPPPPEPDLEVFVDLQTGSKRTQAVAWLRTVSPDLSGLPMHEVMRKLDGKPNWSLGVHSPERARSIRSNAMALGLTAHLIPA